MPRATVSVETLHYDLKTCPPDGFVKLRRMPYGQWLHRQELALKMTIESQGRGRDGAMKGQMLMANKTVTVFEFSQCIVDHNLEDDNGNPLEFNSPVAIERLDPKIGNEIGQYISELHEFDSGNSESESFTP